jgi:IclR family transcriptional regulator, pca regulon regulatory protein
MSIPEDKLLDTPMLDTGLRRSEAMGGLAKGLAIIEMFGAGYAQLTVADAARGSDTTRASARRCLLTLTGLGYLEFDGKFYKPKARLRRLGGQAVNTGSLAEYARPILADACERLDEPIALTILDGRSSLCVARVAASRVVSTGVQVGARLPAYCSATGRLLLSTLEDEEIHLYLKNTEIVARTPRTITDPDALFEQIVAARDTGVAYSDEELELGMRAMAVPVYGRNNEILAAMSLSTSSARVSLKTMQKEYLPKLTAAANALHNVIKET